MDMDGNFQTKSRYDGLKVIPISEKLVKLLQDDEVSKNFLYAFRDAVSKLIGDDGNFTIGLPSDLVDEELERLIERAYKMKGKKLDEVSQQTISSTVELWPYIVPFTNFLNFLEIITFIARESK